MKLASIVNKDYILTGDQFNTVMEAVEAFITLFVKRENLPLGREETREIVANREALGGTLLPSGIAIPHGRLEGFEDILIGMWVPSHPVETENGTVRILFFFLTSKAGSSLYLPVLSSIGKYFKQADFLDSLSGKSADEIYNVLKSIQLKKEILISDIMDSEFASCSMDMTLAELADIFYQKKVRYLPVVDKDQKQIGEVTIKDLLSRGVPDYAKRLGDVSFLRTLEPFEALLREEDRIPVKEIMRKPSRMITPGASIIEAVMLIATKDIRHIPVLDDGKVVGMVDELVILEKVLRA